MLHIAAPIIPITALLLTGLAALPQDSAPDTKLGPAPGKRLDDGAKELQAIVDEYEATLEEFKKLYEAADESEKAQLYEEKYPDPDDWASRVMKIAEQNAKTDTACDALTWVASRTFGDHQAAALAALVKDHFASERMAEVAFVLVRDPKGQSTVQRLINESPHRSVQGVACLALAQTKNQRGGDESEWNTRGKYVALMTRVANEFADVEFRGILLGPMAKGALFALENIGIGKSAPEIEGEDVDGVAFKLSDYRGKVVMLDFWGHW